MDPLTLESARYARLKDRLRAEFDDLDEETLADTLEGLSDLGEIVSETIRSALEDETRAEALKPRIDAMRERRDRFQRAGRRKRELCAQALTEAGLTKLLAPDFTLSLRTGSTRLVVHDEARIPEAFWRPRDPTLAKRELTEALKAGSQIEGASLAAGEPTLSVRVK